MSDKMIIELLGAKTKPIELESSEINPDRRKIITTIKFDSDTPNHVLFWKFFAENFGWDKAFERGKEDHSGIVISEDSGKTHEFMKIYPLSFEFTPSKKNSLKITWMFEEFPPPDMPHYSLKSSTLIEYLAANPEKWWSVDGDHTFECSLCFPCPSDEIIAEIRESDDFWLLDFTPGSLAAGEIATVATFDLIADTNNNGKHETWALSRKNSKERWLLMEDDPLV